MQIIFPLDFSGSKQRRQLTEHTNKYTGPITLGTPAKTKMITLIHEGYGTRDGNAASCTP